MNLLFAINHKFIPLLLSCLHSVSLRGGEIHYDAYILHSDLLPEDEAYIEGSAAPCITFHFIPVPEHLFDGFPESRRYPVQIYYRLAAPLLLPEHLDRILYLDVDTVVINPLRELYQVDFGENYFAACTHTRAFLEKFNQFRLRTEKDVPYINTGVMMMNLPQLRRHFSLSAVRDFGLKHQHLLLLPDQDILTALYGDKVTVVSSLKYNLSDRVLTWHTVNSKKEKIDLDWVRDNSVVIHYFGKNKPWNEHYFGILDTFFHQYGLPIRAYERANS